MMWDVVFSEKPLTAEENMKVDFRALNSLEPTSKPRLCFHHWKRQSATYGHLVDPNDFFSQKALIEKAWDLARRPTGGGIVFHAYDLSFSVLIPANHPSFSENTLENYAFVNEAVLGAVKEFIPKVTENLEFRPSQSQVFSHLGYVGANVRPVMIPEDSLPLDEACRRFCMARPTKYDVVWQGKKIAGAAQRKTKKGFLHQGTIALTRPKEEELRDLLIPGTKVIEAIQLHTCPLLTDEINIEQARQELRYLLQKWILVK